MRLAHLARNHDFIYVDENIETLPDGSPDIVVIHAPLNLGRHAENLVISNWGAEVPTVCYGSYPTLFPSNTTKYCTSTVIGDICSVWNNIVADFRKKRLKRIYTSEKIRHFDVDRRFEMRFGFNPFFSQIKTSFGCHCAEEHRDYCYENVLFKNAVRWNIKKAAEAIAQTKRKAIFVLDDDFLYDIKYSMKLLEMCWRYKKMWIFQTKSTVFEKPELFRRLRDDGVRIIYLKEDWLGRDLIKNIENEAFLKEKEYQIGMIHNCRITAGCRIRLGYEGENSLFYQRLLKFLTKLRIDIVELAVQTPLPMTETHKAYMAKGQIAEDYSLYDQWMPVVNTPGMAPQALYSTMEWLRDRFYSWDSIMLRNIIVSPRLGFYNTVFFYLIPNLSYRSNFLEKVGYPP